MEQKKLYVHEDNYITYAVVAGLAVIKKLIRFFFSLSFLFFLCSVAKTHILNPLTLASTC